MKHVSVRNDIGTFFSVIDVLITSDFKKRGSVQRGNDYLSSFPCLVCTNEKDVSFFVFPPNESDGTLKNKDFNQIETLDLRSVRWFVCKKFPHNAPSHVPAYRIYDYETIVHRFSVAFFSTNFLYIDYIPDENLVSISNPLSNECVDFYLKNLESPLALPDESGFRFSLYITRRHFSRLLNLCRKVLLIRKPFYDKISSIYLVLRFHGGSHSLPPSCCLFMLTELPNKLILGIKVYQQLLTSPPAGFGEQSWFVSQFSPILLDYLYLSSCTKDKIKILVNDNFNKYLFQSAFCDLYLHDDEIVDESADRFIDICDLAYRGLSDKHIYYTIVKISDSCVKQLPVPVCKIASSLVKNFNGLLPVYKSIMWLPDEDFFIAGEHIQHVYDIAGL